MFDDTFDNTPHHPILTEPEPTGFSTHEVEFHDGHRTDSYDFDGDGHVDLRTIDFDNDGRPEVTARDTDDDGRFDEIQYDWDEDGKAESVARDTDLDGKYDTAAHSSRRPTRVLGGSGGIGKHLMVGGPGLPTVRPPAPAAL